MSIEFQPVLPPLGRELSDLELRRYRIAFPSRRVVR